MKLNWKRAEALVYGGAILGGGGGGSAVEGLETVDLALKLGSPEMVSLSETHLQDCVVTVSAVGAPAARDGHVTPMDYVRCVSLVMDTVDRSVAGLIQNEMGGFASANGLIQSAVLGLPIIDAPCNGRAHPLAVMGSLGLHKRPDYLAVQAACGGNPDEGRRVEILVRGQIDTCSALIREASVQAGGMVAVARNPVEVSWLEKSAAVGAMEFTMALGEAFLAAQRSGRSSWQAVADHLSGEIVVEGTISKVELVTRGGFDMGTVIMEGGAELCFLNEYMLAEMRGKRCYTFPDLIATFDTKTGEVINTADVKEGAAVAVVATKLEHLVLGAGMRDNDLYARIEKILDRPVVVHVFGGQ